MVRRSNDVDDHVGRCVRERRNALGMSQEKLADAIGIASQQVQKYEIGLNRVTAGRLWDIAKNLEVDVGYFFEGIERRPKRKAKPRKSPTATKAKRIKPRKRRN